MPNTPKPPGKIKPGWRGWTEISEDEEADHGRIFEESKQPRILPGRTRQSSGQQGLGEGTTPAYIQIDPPKTRPRKRPSPEHPNDLEPRKLLKQEPVQLPTDEHDPDNGRVPELLGENGLALIETPHPQSLASTKNSREPLL